MVAQVPTPFGYASPQQPQYALSVPASAAPYVAQAQGAAAVPSAPTKAAPAAPISPYASAAYGGLQAGSAATGAYDATSGAVSTLGAAATGAATGAIVGGPVGALVGGAAGLLTGGLNAWLSVGSRNKAKREQERILKRAEAKQAEQYRIARDDALSQLAYDREQAERTRAWAKSVEMRAALDRRLAEGVAREDRYIATGRT